jgi:hypothetical protein
VLPLRPLPLHQQPLGDRCLTRTARQPRQQSLPYTGRVLRSSTASGRERAPAGAQAESPATEGGRHQGPVPDVGGIRVDQGGGWGAGRRREKKRPRVNGN